MPYFWLLAIATRLRIGLDRGGRAIAHTIALCSSWAKLWGFPRAYWPRWRGTSELFIGPGGRGTWRRNEFWWPCQESGFLALLSVFSFTSSTPPILPTTRCAYLSETRESTPCSSVKSFSALWSPFASSAPPCTWGSSSSPGGREISWASDGNANSPKGSDCSLSVTRFSCWDRT